MKNRNNIKSSHRLTFDEAVEIWLLSWQGEFQNRIAAKYDVNSGRVNEVLKEKRHIGSRKVALTRLGKSSSDAA